MATTSYVTFMGCVKTWRALVSAGPAALVMMMVWAGFAPAAQAVTSQEAVEAGSFKLEDLTNLESFLDAIGGKELGKVEVSGAEDIGGAVRGSFSIKSSNWSITVVATGKKETSFLVLQAEKNVLLKDIFGSRSGIDKLPIINASDQAFILTADDVNIAKDDLPEGLRTFFAPYYPNTVNYALQLSRGLNKFDLVNVDNSGPFRDLLKFLGATPANTGSDYKIRLHSLMDDKIMRVLLGGSYAKPSLVVKGTIPEFKPAVGGTLKLGTPISFSVVGGLDYKGFRAGLEGTADVSIGKRKLPFSLAASSVFSLKGGPPALKLEANAFKATPYDRAFGVSWLTLEDLKLVFSAKSSGSLSVGVAGATKFGSKAILLKATTSIGSNGVSVAFPKKLTFEVSNNGNKVPSLGLHDLVAAYNTLDKAAGGKRQIKKYKLIDVDIAGLKRGEGPRLDMNLTLGPNTGFEITGALRAYGSPIAIIEEAWLKPTEGLYVKAYTKKFNVGPITFPQSGALLELRYDTEANKFADPKLVVTGAAPSVFGSKDIFHFSLAPNGLFLSSEKQFGSALKFDLKAAAAGEFKSLKDMQKADYRLNASLKSDPAKWARTSGKEAVKAAVNELGKQFDAAKKELATAKDNVRKLNDEIKKQREIVEKDTANASEKIKKAENEVSKLKSEISRIDGVIKAKKSKIKKCNQTKRICVAWLFGCKKHANVPNYPARAVCEIENTKFRGEVLFNETKKAGVIAAREIASETLATLRKGLEAVPTDLDPRVAGVIVARDAALETLSLAELSVEGLDQFSSLAGKGI